MTVKTNTQAKVVVRVLGDFDPTEMYLMLEGIGKSDSCLKSQAKWFSKFFSGSTSPIRWTFERSRWEQLSKLHVPFSPKEKVRLFVEEVGTDRPDMLVFLVLHQFSHSVFGNQIWPDSGFESTVDYAIRTRGPECSVVVLEFVNDDKSTVGEGSVGYDYLSEKG